MTQTRIWKTPATIKDLNDRSKGTLCDFLNITFTEIGDDYLIAQMPVTDRVKQPLGLMNGGTSCVIGESVGSTAANIVVDITKQYCVGLSITTNHLRPARNGTLTAIARPEHIGQTTQVWSIDIRNEAQKLVSVNRLTVAVKSRDSH